MTVFEAIDGDQTLCAPINLIVATAQWARRYRGSAGSPLMVVVAT
jgi:hypothetical protein